MPAQQHQPDPNKFDLRTHHFDGRGRLKKVNHYRMHNHKGVNYFERPVGSGNLFSENNEPAGRVEFLEIKNERGHVIKSKSFDFKAEHKDYVAPLSGQEKLHFENEQLKNENSVMKAALAEIEAIRAENEKLKAAVAEKVGSRTKEEKPSALAQAGAAAPEVKK